jgi:hypothetical protein
MDTVNMTKKSRLDKLIRRIADLEIKYLDISNEAPIDVRNKLKKIRQEVTQSRYREALQLLNTLKISIQQRNERYKRVTLAIENFLVTDISFFESNP